MLIIGLIGQKRVGKDTTADIIKGYYNSENDNFITMALADPIKDIARVMFNFTENQLYGAEKDILDTKWNIKPRDFFEKFGTEIMQYDIYKYLPGLNVPERKFWVYSLLGKIDNIIDNRIDGSSSKGKELPIKNTNIIITDVRGMHELEEIKKKAKSDNRIDNGLQIQVIFIKIIRPDLEQSQAGQTHSSHITQLEPNQIPDHEIHATIVNNGSIDDLKAKVKNIIDQYI